MEFKEQLGPDDFRNMYLLEADYYDESHITPYQEAYRWYLAFPWSNCCLFDQDVLVGFLDLFPIGEALYAKILNGEFNDADLKQEDIVDVFSHKGNRVHMFLSCIVIRKEYRKTDALKRLLQKQVAFYEPFLSGGLKVGNIITDNVTRQGEEFSARLGFERGVHSTHDSVIHICDYKDFVKRIEEL